ncbi:hypothetical protein TNCV_1264061 [Trichonephila clavipes]|nr:hypothetical protein TNCV_1264061 [Trichonephila clavipes]
MYNVLTLESTSHSQYGGYDLRLVAEWVRVRLPSKTWLYLLREKSRSLRLKWIPVSKGKAAHLFLLYAGIIVYNKNLYSSVAVLYVSVHLSHVLDMYPSNKHTTTLESIPCQLFDK